MIQVKLRLKVSGTWFSGIVDKHSVTFKILECKSIMGSMGCSNLVEIRNINENLDEIIEDLVNLPTVMNVEMSSFTKGIAYGIIKINHCGICSNLHNSDCFLISYSSAASDEIEWKIVSLTESPILDVMNDLKKSGVDVTLLSKTPIDPEILLTERQQKIIEVAFKRGFFDSPKRINMARLSKLFDISVSTISEMIRRAEHKVISNYLKESK